MKKNIKIIILTLIIVITLVFFLFYILSSINLKNNNKYKIVGNNKSNEEIEKFLLNVNSYKANIDVTIISNKNENRYKIIQEVRENYAKQIVTEPENIANVEFTYENSTLKIQNSKISASKIYEDYPYVSNNILFLTDFIEQYKKMDTAKTIDEEETVIIELLENNSVYNSIKRLKINKQTMKPIYMEIQDINNKKRVYIVYNEIELNKI
ncbi:MAG: hypothetical protein IKG56_02040 [Clostridia bacterium]|nr:hypothetical protein [Clostridia bacterium]